MYLEPINLQTVVNISISFFQTCFFQVCSLLQIHREQRHSLRLGRNRRTIRTCPQRTSRRNSIKYHWTSLRFVIYWTSIISDLNYKETNSLTWHLNENPTDLSNLQFENYGDFLSEFFLSKFMKNSTFWLSKTVLAFSAQ